MRRKNRDVAEFELVTGIAGLFLACCYFVPAFRALVFAGLLLFVLALSIFIIYRVVLHKSRIDIPNRTVSINTHQPSPAPASLSTPLPALSQPQSSEAPPKPAPTESLSDKLRKIDWFQFEKLVAAIYQAKGFSVERLGGAKADGGIDLIIELAGVKSAVQCKHWKTWKVKTSDIREFLGALTDTRIPNGIFITGNGYTADAEALAAKHNIQLVGRRELTIMLDETDWRYNPAIKSILDDTRKLCPKCGNRMVLRTATKGQNAGNPFWGCYTFPRCSGILPCG